MPTKLFEQTGEFQFPRLSPTGFRIGAGASHASVITRFSPDKTFTGRVARPLSDSLIAFIVDIEDSPAAQTAALMLWNGTDAPPSDSGVPHDTVACNDFDAADGHWGAWLETERRTGQHGRLVIDGRLVGYGYGGVRTTNGWVASPNLTPTPDYPGGRVEVFQIGGGVSYTVALHPEFNRWTCSTQGWVGFGYWGKPWIIAPNGAIVDVSHGWGWPESPPVLVHRPDGKVYAYTHTIDPVSEQSYVFGRWLRFPIVPKIAGQVIPFGAAWLDARYVSGKTLLVGGTDVGYCAAWQVDDTEVETLLPVTALPPPVTDVPWVADPKGTKFDVRTAWRASATAERVVNDRAFLWFRKSDGVAGDPQGAWGAWFDHTIDVDHEHPVAGLWMDSSTGQLLNADTPQPLNRWMTFQPNRLWFPLVGESPWEQEFSTGFHWREYVAGKIDPVATLMRFESGHAVIGGVIMRYRHTYDASTQDGYVKYSYYDKDMIERRWELWKTGVLVQFTQPVPITGKEAFVTPWVTPTNDILPHLEGEIMPEFDAGLWAQFRARVPPTFMTLPAGQGKHEAAAAYTYKFAQQLRASKGDAYGAKRTSSSAPLSADVFAVREGSKLYGFDLFQDTDGDNTSVNASPDAMDITGQFFQPVDPVDYLGGSDPGDPGDPGGPSTGAMIFTQTGKNGVRYMTAEDGGGEQGVTIGGRPAGLMTASRTQADIDQYGTAWQEWQVAPASAEGITGVSIKCGEFYATLWDTGGKMIFNRRAVGPGEIWRLHPMGSGVAIQGYNDKFVCAERDAQGNITGEVNVNRASPGEWETFQTKGGTATNGDAAPSAYGVTLNGRYFSVPLVGASMLYAAAPGADYIPALDENKELGFNLVRLFCGQLDQVGQVIDSGLYQRIAKIQRDCDDRAMLLYPAYVTNAQAGYDLIKHANELEGVFRGAPNVRLKEAANEADNSTQGGRLDINTLKRIRDGKEGIWTLSADIRDGDTSTRLSTDFYAFHFGRDKDPSQLSVNATVRDAFGHPGFNQEQIGADEVNKPGSRSNDVSLFGRLGVGNNKYRFGGIFHSEAGLNARRLGPVQRQAAINFIKGSLIGSF